MKRKRIAEINNWALEPANYPSLEPDTSEIAEIAALALRATDPDMVMVPEKGLIEITEQIDEHPEGWDYPCLCRLCKSYAEAGDVQEDQP